SDSNLTPSTRYYYSIRSKWNDEYSCDELFVSDSTPFNTNIIPVKNDPFKLYPNPAYTKVQIEGQEGINEIQLLSIAGKVIRQYHQREDIIVDDLKPGFYLIRINKTYTYKILKL